jgi:nucleotide-binding universal stress UspA family protein
MKKVLIAIDESPASEIVADNGLTLTKALNAEVAFVSVVDTNLLMTDGGVTPRDMEDLFKHDLVKRQKELIESKFKELPVHSFIKEGTPYEGILQTAKEWNADVIVIGTHGRTGLAHLILGSVAEKVVRHSTIPLFIVPTKNHIK